MPCNELKVHFNFVHVLTQQRDLCEIRGAWFIQLALRISTNSRNCGRTSCHPLLSLCLAVGWH